MVATAYQSMKDKLSDTLWRLNNLYWIIDEDSKRVKFKMKPCQRHFYDNMWYWNQLLKARQRGFSTLIDLIILDLCLFNDNIEAGIIAHTLKAVQHIFATKVKYPYENLPRSIRERIPAIKCDANELKLTNNSWLRVSTSFMSSTLRALHVSEHAKICAKYPKKAQELKEGTMPALHEGSYFFNESTAEGGAGDFYDACMQAMADTAREKEGIPLKKKQARFHFYDWQGDSKNETEPKGVVISDELKRYFEYLKTDHDIELIDRKKAWYALTRDGAMGLGRLMKRQHPSFPAESFEQAVEGAVFGIEMEKVRSEGRIRFLPYQENELVYTFWDLGIGHPTAIIFAQFIREEVHVIDYHEQTGRGIIYNAGEVKKKPYIYGQHFVPHDTRNRNPVTETPMIDTMRELLGSTKVTLIERIDRKEDSIQAATMIYPHVFFDTQKTTRLVKCLGFYRYEWDDNKLKFTNDPVDDWSCLVAGTKISTTKGDIPIEQVEKGDYVVTPTGNKEVLFSGRTKKAKQLLEICTNSGRKIVCTPEHKIFFDNSIDISDALRCHSILFKNTFLRNMLWKLLYLTGINSGFKAAIINGLARRPCIKPFGNIITVLCQEVIGYITKTRTHLIMILQTLSCLQKESIRFCMANAVAGAVAKPISSNWQKPDGKQVNGTEAKKARPFIRLWECILGRNTKSKRLKTALFAEKSIQLTGQQGQSIARKNVQTKFKTQKGKSLIISKNALALFVKSLLSVLDILRPERVARIVPINCANKPRDVYDLTIKDDHCYYANGILVSNSDGADAFQCMGMAWVTMPIGGKRLGRTIAMAGNIPPAKSSYDNKTLTRGLRIH